MKPIKPKRNKGSAVSFILRLALITVAVYSIFAMVELQDELMGLKKTLKIAQNDKNNFIIGNDELKNLLENASTEQLIERAARDKLDYAYANDEIYVKR